MKSFLVLTTGLFLALLLSGCDRVSQQGDEDSSTAISAVEKKARSKNQRSRMGDKIHQVNSLAALREQINRADSTTLRRIAYDIEELLNRDPENAKEILRLIANAIAEEDFLEAAQFLSHCKLIHEESQQVLQELAQAWFGKDEAGMRQALTALTDPNSENYSTFTASNLLNGLLVEQGATTQGLTSWLAWIESLDSGNIQGMSLDILLNQQERMKEEQFEALSSTYFRHIKNPDLQSFLPNFGEVIARRKPGQVIELLDQIPGGLYHDHTSLRVMAELGRSHPDVAATWLSDDLILSNLFRPDAEAQANIDALINDDGPNADYEREMLRINREAKYDRALTEYIRAAAEKYPQDALRSADAIHSPELREALIKELRAKFPTEEPSLPRQDQ